MRDRPAGVFLAVFGQVYQTGADAYELFQGWLLLSLVWILVSRFAGLWLTGMVLLNLALIFYGTQVAIPNEAWTASGMFLLLAGLDAAALALGEWVTDRGVAWLLPPWLRQILLAAGLTFLTIPAFLFIVEGGHSWEKTTAWALPAFVIAVAAACLFYFRRKNILSVSSCTLASCVVLLAAIGRGVFQGHEEAWQFLLFGLIVVAVSGGAAFLLVRISGLMKGGPSHA